MLLYNKKVSLLIALLLAIHVASGNIAEINESIQEIHALGLAAPYFENKLQEASSLTNNESINELTQEALSQKARIIATYQLAESLKKSIQANAYSVNLDDVYLSLNQNDVAHAEEQLAAHIEEISRLESGKALGGLINTVSFYDSLKAFFYRYKYFLIAFTLFLAMAFSLSYATIKRSYYRAKIRSLGSELAELHAMEKNLQKRYFDKKQISKKEFTTLQDRYADQISEAEEEMASIRDKLSQ